MRLILCRHGNTFVPGDKIIWAGARTDLPLVEKGLLQAKDIGNALVAQGIIPARIYTGSLLRTIQTAQLIAGITGTPDVEIAEELKEIDYGLWEGRSNDDIRRDYGAALLDAWQQNSQWPGGAGLATG